MSRGICVPATVVVTSTSSTRNGRRFSQVDLHRSLVATGAKITCIGVQSSAYLRVTMRRGICVPATVVVTSTSRTRNGRRFSQVDLHGPLVATGAIITCIGVQSLAYLSVTMRRGICVPATVVVTSTSSTRNGRRFSQVDLHGPLVATGAIITSGEILVFSRIQEHPLKFCNESIGLVTHIVTA